MKKNAKDLLTEARKRIAKSENWCKLVSARTKTATGYEGCRVTDPDANQWCATGAVEAGVPYGQYWSNQSALMQAIVSLDRNCPLVSVRIFNDKNSTTHADILNVFDEAIGGFDSN